MTIDQLNPKPGEVVAKCKDGRYGIFDPQGWKTVEAMQNDWRANGTFDQQDRTWVRVPESVWKALKGQKPQRKPEPQKAAPARPKPLDAMTLEELKDIAKELGISKASYSRWTKKDSAISKIKQAQDGRS